MSLPTTPARSIARSTVSTPSTPRHGTSPQELTPRSKVKAMLAAIDDDDSDTNLPSEPKDRSRAPLSSIAGNAQKVRERDQLEPKAALNSEGSENGDGDEEEDEEPLFIPRGRLAARLKGQNTARDDSSAGQEDSLEENAYDRIRKKLLSRGSKIEREIHEEDENDVEATGEKGQSEFECRQEPVGLPSEDVQSLPSEDVQSPARSPRSTPGLFLTPEKAPISQTPRNEAVAASGSDSDLPSDPHSNNRVQELVARVRAEREAKQAKQDELRKERIAKQRSFEKELSRDASSGRDLSDEDKLTDRRLTQQSRPTRKASKKAVEEMNRETQRMSRNMQLAHQAGTKKKITKDSLFARFNFRTSGTPVAEAAQQLSSSTADSSAPASDMEVIPDQQSPPTSPIDADEHSVAPLYHDSNKHNVNTEMEADPAERQDELPSMLEIMTQSHHVDKGKGKEVDHAKNQTTSNTRESKKTVFTQPPLKIRPPNPFSQATDIDLDSDSDLEISFLKKPRSKRDVFDRLPASKVQEGRSLQTLRALAHLTSPNKQMRGKKATISLSDMQTSLQRRARQQAVEERAAKIEDLKRRGIIVQTAEERQQDQAEVENLLEKARREGEEIMQKEKRAAKKAKIANGEVDDLPDSSDEDEDYHDNQGDEPEVELSGSEEDEEIDVLASVAEDSANEDDAEGGGISLEEDRATTNGFVDDAASEDGDDEHDEGIETDDGSDEDDGFSKAQIQRPRRNKMVIDDDDDEQVEEKPRTPRSPAVEVPQFPKGQTDFGVVPMGMTQAFAATMADTQTQSCEDDQEQDSMALLDTVPEPNFPLYDNNDSLQMIEDSQNDLLQPETNTYKEIDLHFSQSQIQIDTLGDTQDLVMVSQMSEIPDPTQDVGFVLSSPAPQRLASEPPSTVDTVLLSGAAGNTSPIKRGRLQRRAPIEEDISDLDESQAMTLDRDVINDTTNAFDAMRKARKASKAVAAKEAFDRKKSEAKGMVEEQAQESEDEYAGLGGASDEDSGEEDEDVNAMMDHGEVKVDERRLAQLFA